MQAQSERDVRLESLEKIRALGIDPYPAPKVDVNFTTDQFNTSEYKSNLAKGLERLKKVGPQKASELLSFLLQHKFRISNLLADEQIVQSYSLAEEIEFDDSLAKDPQSLESFVSELRETALGSLSKQGNGACRKIYGTERPFCAITRC